MTKNNIFLMLLLANTLFAFSQKSLPTTPPKLVIGIVVDQMRYDYLFRYWNKYSENGFKRLVTEGHNCENTMYNYVPTYTGPGHASIYSGTTPAIHGIVSNDWYVRNAKKEIYCVSDSTVTSVGTTSNTGRMSPINLLASNISDELKLANISRSKVIGIALKDRSAILPAGHSADAAYWFDAGTGNFISSSFYLKELPKWVQDFNAQKLPETYLSKDWRTLMPISDYTESIADSNRYEGAFATEKAAVFPHKLPEIAKVKGFSTLLYTPFGSTLTKELAIKAIESEGLGNDNYPDLLAISFSSPDFVGHQFGPSSIEMEDTYLRLDREIADLLQYAEKKVGKTNVLVFLTADHGAVYNANYLIDNKIPAGRFDLQAIKRYLNTYTTANYKAELVSEVTNQQVYLDDAKIAELGYSKASVADDLADILLEYEGVAHVLTGRSLQRNEFVQPPFSLIQKGYFPKRCGDIMINFEPSWLEFPVETGTSHGSPYTYDTHVPLLWWGWKIPSGSSSEPISITDIAPTLSLILNVPYPNGCTGKPIERLMKKCKERK